MPTTTNNGIVIPAAGTEPADLYGVATRLGNSIDTILTNNAIPTAYVNVTYNGSWTDNGGGYEETSYRKIGDRVELRGMAKHATTSTTGLVFTLPAGFRPAKSRLWDVRAGNGGLAEIEITSGGVVNINAYRASGNANGVSFDAIFFDTAS